MRIHIAARRSFPILRLVVAVLCISGTMFPQASSEPSPLSLQQAATIAMEKNPLRKAALADTKAASAGDSGSAFVSDAPNQLLRNGDTG